MTLPSTYDDLVKLVAEGYVFRRPFDGNITAARSSAFTISSEVITRCAWTAVLPSLPSGVAGYRLLGGHFYCGQVNRRLVVARETAMGSLDIGTNTFTDGAAAPTLTVLGNSYQVPLLCVAEVTTALNATPGNMTVTTVNHQGVTATSTAVALTASAPVRSAAILNMPMSRDVTAMAQSAGTTPSGVVQIVGLEQLNMSPMTNQSTMGMAYNPITRKFTFGPLLGAGDVISIWNGALSTGRFKGRLTFLAEPSS